MIDVDMDLALESLLFVATHFIINTQFYCAYWNASVLRQMTTSLTEEIDKSICFFFKFIIFMLPDNEK